MLADTSRILDIRLFARNLHLIATRDFDGCLEPNAKFMGLRHGGNVEGAETGLTDAQLRALSGHRTTTALLRYAQTTKSNAARVRGSAHF